MDRVVTTYLEMRGGAASREQSSQVRDQHFEVRERKDPDWVFNREMYFKVGEKWKWIDKRPWRDAQWKEYAHDPNLRTFAGYYDDQVAGYYELQRTEPPTSRDLNAADTAAATEESSVEIAYFGLLPEFIERGLGGALLTSAIENAWAWAPSPARVWVHTCNRDHPNALANYQARGFKIYKVEGEAAS